MLHHSTHKASKVSARITHNYCLLALNTTWHTDTAFALIEMRLDVQSGVDKRSEETDPVFWELRQRMARLTQSWRECNEEFAWILTAGYRGWSSMGIQEGRSRLTCHVQHPFRKLYCLLGLATSSLLWEVAIARGTKIEAWLVTSSFHGL